MSAHRHNLFALPFLMLAVLLLSGCGPNLFEYAMQPRSLGCCGLIVVVLDIVALVEVLGSARTTGNKILWSLIIIFLPFLGFFAYYLFGRGD